MVIMLRLSLPSTRKNDNFTLLLKYSSMVFCRPNEMSITALRITTHNENWYDKIMYLAFTLLRSHPKKCYFSLSCPLLCWWQEISWIIKLFHFLLKTCSTYMLKWAYNENIVLLKELFRQWIELLTWLFPLEKCHSIFTLTFLLVITRVVISAVFISNHKYNLSLIKFSFKFIERLDCLLRLLVCTCIGWPHEEQLFDSFKS